MKTLRPYQRDCVDAILDTLNRVKSCVAVVPTGGGKTIIAAKLIVEWPYGNVLFLAHTQELIYQSAEKIGIEIGYKPHIEMGLHGAELDTLWDGDMVVIGSVQSMLNDRRLKKYQNHPFNLIIIDEAHHATSSSYLRVVDYFRALNPELRVVGITATPNRSDKTALGLVFEDVAYSKEIGWMVSQGWLVPFRQIAVHVESLDLGNVKVKRKPGQEADFAGAELEAILTEEKTLHEMAQPIIEQLGTRQAIVFTAGVKHAHLLADILNRHRMGCASAVDGTMDKNERASTLKAFSQGQLQFLTNCAVLTEGFDAPATAAVVMGRPTKSVSLYTQMLGRALRPLPGTIEGFDNVADPAWERQMAIATSENPDAVVLDFVGASRNGVVDCYDVLGGNYDVEIRQLAREHLGKGQLVTADDLSLAQQLAALRKAIRNRQHILAQAEYTVEEIDPHRQVPALGAPSPRRGGATDGQVAYLVKLGVPRETALGYSKGQAGAVIESMSSSKCTTKQAATLAKYGIPTEGVNVTRAKAIIDQIAAAGWRLPPGGIK